MTQVRSVTQGLIRQIELDLLLVLNKHYYVNQQTFAQISPHNMAKHELCHLTKALYKIQAACDDTNADNVFILINELAPDLIIYALEVSVSFEIPWWNDICQIETTSDEPLLNCLCNKIGKKYNSEEEMLADVRRMLIKSVSRLGHLCDKTDHGQDAYVRVSSEVIFPFLKASFSIANFYSLDLHEQYQKRLRFVESKYVGQLALNK
ncbi:MAG: hypothetical protein F6K21_15000 [Symploca sp. SIO2D2]|nr:hypothetical protein [Symploca sp. SIO2D2]